MSRFNEINQRNTMSDMKQQDSLNQMNQRASNTHYNQAHSQPRQLPQQNKADLQTQPITSKNDKKSLNEILQQDNHYQSSLLSRFVKEPRLPPSTNNLNKRKSFAPINKSMRVGTVAQQKLNMTTYNDQQNYHSNQEAKPNQNSQGKKKSYNKPVISYRNQSEIMKKIFGNEQYYNQVKTLFKGPQDDKILTSNQNSSQYNNHADSQFKGNLQLIHRAQSTPHQDKLIEMERTEEKRMTMHQQFSSPINNFNNYSDIHKDKAVIAKSREKLDQIDFNRQQTVPKNIELTPIINKGQAQGSDQVEKALFDLQDVKNNYFQEKQMFDQKLQKIQIKQQNSTIYGSSFLQGANQTTKTQNGFFNNQRPMTQGGSLFKNHQLINDENILQGDLEKVNKEELRERLVVAEMVMKKLFQRNKDLEDMVQQKQEDNDSQNKNEILSTNTQSQKIEQSPCQADFDSENNCKNCVELRKELTFKENEMQKQINDLQLQILDKANSIKDQNHLEYLRQRLEETMAEAKRHFNNYIQLRNTYNKFLESRLSLDKVQGGMKGQKLQGDILSMLKKNLEVQDNLMKEEQQNYKKSLLKFEQIIEKKDQFIGKKDKKIKKLEQEIERRQFLENKVQKYVKGLINQNQKSTEFLQGLIQKFSKSDKYTKEKLLIEDFLRKLENKDYDENEGESTENENEDEQNSVEVDDL